VKNKSKIIKKVPFLILNFRKIIRIGAESLLWIFASFIASLIRYDGLIAKDKYNSVLFLGILGSLAYFINNIFFAVYKTQLVRASFEETSRISLSILFTTLILFLIRIFLEFPNLPILTVVLCGLISLILQLSTRIILSGRLNKKLFNRPNGIKTLIYGSGITAQQVVDQMLYRSSNYDPIGFLDDDNSKSNFMFRGRKVLGTIDNLEKIVRNENPKILVVAIAGISSSVLINLERRCKDLNLSIRIIPNALEIMERNLKLSDISDLSIEDILGRQQINYDKDDLIDFLKNKKILITGAGGSIGSEIARQIHSISFSDLFLLDRNENSLLDLCLSIYNDGLFDSNNIILCDIRDSVSVSKIISQLKPDVVFHAAALKHLTLLEKFPDEAYKTNVLATKNLIETCLKNNVTYFINISTDKAAEPISQLGKSKHICERIISAVNETDKKYISVRFGNVVGSNGSFLNTFRQQIKNGGPITITHKEVSRYFMTIEEAVYLVLKSILVGRCGETLILDMGDPIKINDVAKKMIADSGKSIEIKYTGLRPGEKLNEILVGQNEIAYYGENKNIRHTKVEPIKLSKISDEF
jgi:dTDP-glucose 4,6-dehydratase